MQITVTMNIAEDDAEVADPGDDTGLTSEAHTGLTGYLMDQLGADDIRVTKGTR